MCWPPCQRAHRAKPSPGYPPPQAGPAHCADGTAPRPPRPHHQPAKPRPGRPWPFAICYLLSAIAYLRSPIPPRRESGSSCSGCDARWKPQPPPVHLRLRRTGRTHSAPTSVWPLVAQANSSFLPPSSACPARSQNTRPRAPPHQPKARQTASPQPAESRRLSATKRSARPASRTGKPVRPAGPAQTRCGTRTPAP